MAQGDTASLGFAEEEAAPQGHSTYAVFSVLSNVLDKDEVSLHEFEEKDRPKDDYIDHETLREWFSRRLTEYRIYCSLPLFGNVVLRHVLQADPAWKGVGDIKQKRYNLTWMSEPAGSEFEIDAFFARIKDEKEKVDRTKVEPKPVVPSPDPPAATGASAAGARPPVFLDPTLLSEWWNRRLEPTDPSICRMRMRDIYDRFVIETNVNMPKALFGELSVRYVLSSPAYTSVVRKGKIHSKRYSLQWRNAPTPAVTAAALPAHPPVVSAAPLRSTAPTPAMSYSSSSSSSSSSPASPAPSSPANEAYRWSVLRGNFMPQSPFPSRESDTWGSDPHPSNSRPVNV